MEIDNLENPEKYLEIEDIEGTSERLDVACHPFIIGELACGSIKNRRILLSLLSSLSMVEMIDNEEVLLFIEKKNLMGKGLGLIDVYLLGASLLSEVSLWTLDTKLHHEASILGIAYKY